MKILHLFHFLVCCLKLVLCHFFSFSTISWDFILMALVKYISYSSNLCFFHDVIVILVCQLTLCFYVYFVSWILMFFNFDFGSNTQMINYYSVQIQNNCFYQQLKLRFQLQVFHYFQVSNCNLKMKIHLR